MFILVDIRWHHELNTAYSRLVGHRCLNGLVEVVVLLELELIVLLRGVNVHWRNHMLWIIL
jgi:hypothetical protein